jgi:hypothetical protein
MEKGLDVFDEMLQTTNTWPKEIMDATVWTGEGLIACEDVKGMRAGRTEELAAAPPKASARHQHGGCPSRV